VLLAFLGKDKLLSELFSKLLEILYTVLYYGYLPLWDIIYNIEANFRVIAIYSLE
jgi:hypothetical protein